MQKIPLSFLKLHNIKFNKLRDTILSTRRITVVTKIHDSSTQLRHKEVLVSINNSRVRHAVCGQELKRRNRRLICVIWNVSKEMNQRVFNR